MRDAACSCLTRVTPRVSAALCVGLQRLQRRESRSQSTFPAKWRERVLGTTLPDARGWTAKCGGSVWSHSPLGKSVARAESRTRSESATTRSVPSAKRVTAHQTDTAALPHVRVRTLPVSHSFTRARQHSAQHKRARHETLHMCGRRRLSLVLVVAGQARFFPFRSSSSASSLGRREHEDHGLPPSTSGHRK